MLATIVNAVLVLLGSAIGLVFRGRISPRLISAITRALGLCVLGIGMAGLTGSGDMLCVIVCMVTGTLLGEGLDLEGRLDGLGALLHSRLPETGESETFSRGFVDAFLLFCVGAMSITGSIEAGMNGNYSVILSKSVLDGVSAVSFAATMGVGVAFSALPLLLYQGTITLLAGWVGPMLPEAVICEMSAVGGALIVALGINMLELGREKLPVANMLPAMFLPILYMPLKDLLTGIIMP